LFLVWEKGTKLTRYGCSPQLLGGTLDNGRLVNNLYKQTTTYQARIEGNMTGKALDVRDYGKIEESG